MAADPSAPAPPDEIEVRVRYGEVDGMGVVYHGHYLVYFELGRTEWLRARGLAYQAVEAAGTLLMVVESHVEHHAPARYDEVLTIRTHLAEARAVRLRFEYEVWRGEERLASGHTVLASTDRTGRPQRLPRALRERIRTATPAAGVQDAPEGGAS